MRPIVSELLHFIDQATNKELDALQIAIDARRQALKQSKTLQLILANGRWFASDGKHQLELGAQLSPVQMLALARKKGPTTEDYELTPKEAETIKKQNPELVGWWDDTETGKRRYYRQREYETAKAQWYREREVFRDERTLVLRLGPDGMGKILELEKKGYSFDIPES